MSSIGWTDAIGAATLDNAKVYPGNRFANWEPNNKPFGVRSHTLATGALNVTAFRDDLTVSLDVQHIPNSDMGKMLRLQMHLKRGGAVTLDTSPDTTIPVFGDCKLAPGADVQIQLTDKTTLEYTLSTVLRGSGVYSLPPGVLPGEFYIWLKADVPGTLGSVGLDSWGANPGPEILQWPDQSISPGGNHGTPPALHRPLWHDAIQNGLPGVYFTPRPPSGAFYGKPTVIFPTNCLVGLPEAEAFVVLRRNTGWETYNDLQSGFWEFGSGVTGPDYNSHYGYPTTLEIADSFGSTTVHGTGAAPIDLAIPHIYNAVSKSDEWTNRINGVEHYTTGTNTVAFPGDGVPGAEAQFGNSRPEGFYNFYGWMFEFLFTSPARTVAQRAAFTAYANSKWALGF